MGRLMVARSISPFIVFDNTSEKLIEIFESIGTLKSA